MHGVFIVGLKDMVINKFDETFWTEILEHAGFESTYHPISNQELNDTKALTLLKSAIKKLNMGDRKFGEVFGSYWIKYFAKEKYFAFFDAYKTTKDFIVNLNDLHKRLTSTLQKPKPPIFEINWETPQSALIAYKSDRGLIHIAVGLLKAVGDYYHEEISVYRVESNLIKVFFKDAV